MTCPQCNANIDDRSNFCNCCGAKQEAGNRTQEAGDRYAPREYRADQQGSPSSGIDLSGLNGKKFLLLALACFGWALLRGVPAVIGLLHILPSIAQIPWGGWHGFGAVGAFVSPLFSVGLHMVVPLILGCIFLRRHKLEERRDG